MKIIDSIEEMKLISKNYPSDKQIGFVPTMGALHRGHLSLIKKSVESCDITVVSIFLNPIQFSPTEDLDKYPKVFEEDCRVAKEAGVDYIFAPKTKDMYGDNFFTTVSVSKITEQLEGESRPTHFDGVTTVVLKLFNIVKPSVAYFGQKDAQQSVVVKKMVSDLNIDINIEVLPIIREKDGLALSSRNIYLTKNERAVAHLINTGLNGVRELFLNGEKNAVTLQKKFKDDIDKTELLSCEYVSIVDKSEFKVIKNASLGDFVVVAVRTGESKTRLIDNIVLS